MKTLTLATVLLLAAAQAASADDGVTEHASVDLAPAAHAFTTLVIDNPLGDVRVEGYDGTSLRIETRKHAPDDDSLERLRVSLVPSADGSVRISTTADGGPEQKPVKRGAVRIDLIIHAPRNARVDATANAGKLELISMEAGGELDSGSGPIRVEHVVGEVLTHSVSGPTTFSDVTGSVDAQSLGSDVDLDTIGGRRLVASVDKGRISGRRVRVHEVELTSNDGHIVLEAEATLRGKIRVASLHGDVDVKLHRHGGVAVRASGVKVDLGPSAQVQKRADGWLEASFGAADDTASVELRSRYGNVQFVIVE
jgi:DUF4097 and DUF4098 domain-containing protein YvlB